MVTASDSQSRGRRFNSQWFCYLVTILVKSLTPISLQAVKFGTDQKVQCGQEGNRRSGGTLAMPLILDGAFIYTMSLMAYYMYREMLQRSKATFIFLLDIKHHKQEIINI